ncbi:MAG: FAD-dependent oxidoreductase [Variibacter sp.]|nr:FAD-dependent oxidoreductase [Variibacter sp.]
MTRTVHIIGAGLAGLSAAVRLVNAGSAVVVHEATGQVGGRCRSYFDQATGLTIDNGNHLVLSGNRAALSFLDVIGTRDRLIGPAAPEFTFVDFKDKQRWVLHLSKGRIPWWVLDPKRRVPGTRLGEYLKLARLLSPPADAVVGDVIACEGPLYERLTRPLLLAALNVEPPQGSAALAGAIIRETLAAGGEACRPLVARSGLSDVFVEPAVAYLAARGASLQLRHEARGLDFTDGRVSAVRFGDDSVSLEPQDAVVLAVPPYGASPLVPGLQTPTAFRAIVNAHFRADPPAGMPPLTGVLNATTEWLFALPGRLSVTVSAGERLLDTPREQLAQTLWREVAALSGVAGELPRWQIVRERRATFAATPAENAKRPPARTAWSNLALAGDWTATGLPATIESAIRSGERAADLLMNGQA